MKQFKLISKSQFKLGTKSILLSSPHPGGNRLMAKVAKIMAQELDAEFLSLDYQSIIEIIRKLDSGNTSDFKLDKSNREFSKPFFPGQYRILEDEDEDEDDEFDDGFEDDDFEDYSISNNRNTAKVFMNLTMAAKDHKKGLADEQHNIVISGISLKKDIEEQQEQVKINSSPFDIHIPDQDLELFLGFLFHEIRNRDSKLVLYLNDVTDIVEGSNQNSGKKLVAGLSKMIQELRKSNIPILFVVGSCPSIVEPKNVNQNVQFYSQVLDGNFYTVGQNGARNYLAMDGTIFNTVLDNFPLEFQKIPILPPSFVFLSLQKTLDPTNRDSVLVKDAHLYQRKLEECLMQYENDLKFRIWEINRASIQSICREMGLTLHEKLVSLLDRNTNGIVIKNKANLSDFLNFLSLKVWNVEQIKQLVFLAAGNTMDSDSSIITLDSMMDALMVIYETDYTRYSAMDSDQIEERMNVIPLTSPKIIPAKEKIIDTPIIESKPIKSRIETLEADLKRRGVKLNAYEKKLLPSIIDPDHISVSLSQLILPSQTKLVLQTLVTLPMLKPEYFSAGVLSKSAIHGVLLFGPPGTGKTMLAKAISKSSGAYFMNISLATVFDKYVGEGEKNMQAVFSLARKLGGPCVIFFDEVDALFGSRRSDTGGSTKREIINVCMAEWDGLGSKNDGILVLGATNRPFDLDDAILRRMPRRVLSTLYLIYSRLTPRRSP